MEGMDSLALSTIMVVLFFGTNFFLCAMFQLVKFMDSPATLKSVCAESSKKLSKPFTGTLECYINLSRELFSLGAVMALTYVCENHWIFPHSSKSYSRDLFLFVVALFFAFAWYTMEPVKDLSLLGREQTEEWKGWMQFIFLLYHYFHAEEVYNSVRVMITCYVWMTGFGNFSFFYIKQDFGWLRVMQMMWRLNFAVLFLMWTHNNTYILYYICPLHTFYFLMVYATMAAFAFVNHGKWGIRLKLFCVGTLIYIIWDVNYGLFDLLFFWLGTDKVVGAGSGSVWEYYFRTSLDHYSAYLGMIFAVNFPLAEQFFTKATGWPLAFTAIALAALSIWWLTNCYFLPKIEYNLSHSYFAIIPLTTYIFFRNITPRVRSMVSMSLHNLGKTTLETYLLQHHIWLTSNAKTLLTIVPNSPWVNFLLASTLFIVVAKELYRLTMSLRGMMMPDDHEITFRNIIGMLVVAIVVYLLALILYALESSLLEIALVCLLLMLVVGTLISKATKNFSENRTYQLWSTRAMYAATGLFIVGLIVIFTLSAQGAVNAADGETVMSAGGDVTRRRLTRFSARLSASISNPLSSFDDRSGPWEDYLQELVPYGNLHTRGLASKEMLTTNAFKRFDLSDINELPPSPPPSPPPPPLSSEQKDGKAMSNNSQNTTLQAPAAGGAGGAVGAVGATALSASPSSKPYTPRKTGSMSFPLYGLMVLFLSAVMLLTMDSFLGFGYLAMLLFGRSLSWEEAYQPLLDKIFRTRSPAPPTSSTPVAGVASSATAASAGGGVGAGKGAGVSVEMSRTNFAAHDAGEGAEEKDSLLFSADPSKLASTETV